MLSFGQATDRGTIRTINQDAICSVVAVSRSADACLDFGLFIVADGVGGHHQGENASALAVNTVQAEILRQLNLSGSAPALFGLPILKILDQIVKMSNAAVLKSIPDSGTTLTAVLIIGDEAHIAHVGDTRAYLITQDSIEQLTEDHTLRHQLSKLGHIAPEDMRAEHLKSVLHRGLGMSDDLDVNTLIRRLPPGAQILVCSDGLWGNVSDDELREIVRNPSLSPQEACNKLVALANERGGSDNISVIVVQMPPA
ncbi:MAG: serine/threonine-protein phosphatase [Anaerolineae bacterium]|nr:serine/threonine-protein phosphatase [Anaerolineae bacterium]